MPSKKTSKRIDFEDFKRRADSPFESAAAGRGYMVELERRAWRARLSNFKLQGLMFRAGKEVFRNIRRAKEARAFAAWCTGWLAKIAEKYNDREIRRILKGKGRKGD